MPKASESSESTRARYDAQIYTNNQAELAHDLSREYSHSTATDGHPRDTAHEITEASDSEHEIAHSSGNEHQITHSSEDGDLGQSWAESGDAPAAGAEQGISLGED